MAAASAPFGRPGESKGSPASGKAGAIDGEVACRGSPPQRLPAPARPREGSPARPRGPAGPGRGRRAAPPRHATPPGPSALGARPRACRARELRRAPRGLWRGPARDHPPAEPSRAAIACAGGGGGGGGSTASRRTGNCRGLPGRDARPARRAPEVGATSSACSARSKTSRGPAARAPRRGPAACPPRTVQLTLDGWWREERQEPLPPCLPRAPRARTLRRTSRGGPVCGRTGRPRLPTSSSCTCTAGAETDAGPRTGFGSPPRRWLASR